MKVTLKCHCGNHYDAREADIKRGWAKTCSKSCAAVKREFGRANATYPDGSKVAYGKKYKRQSAPKYSHEQLKKIADAKRHSESVSYEKFLLSTDDQYLTKQEQLDKIDAEYYASLHPFSGEGLGQWE